jgi:hypothetical protein
MRRFSAVEVIASVSAALRMEPAFATAIPHFEPARM